MKDSKESKTVRQNGTYTSTRKAEVNLRRNPTLHFQIGLILTLLASIFFIEMRMPVKAQVAPDISYDLETPEWADEIRVEQPKPKVEQPVQQPPQQQEPDIILVDDTLQKDIEDTLFPITEPTDEPIPDAAPVEIDLGTFDKPDDVDFFAVEDAPLFPGCDPDSSKEERKQCMSEQISKLINRKFRSDIGADLGLTGIQRTFVQFKVDTDGNVTDIKTRGPHPKLEKEAERVTRLLPKMEPGKQRGVPVNVIYQLPITLQMQD